MSNLNDVKPTDKQKKAFEKKLVESGRNMGEIMVEAGYSPNTAKAPTKLTESRGWQILLEEYLPDEKLAQVHSKGLDASSLDTAHKFLKTAYEIKGKIKNQTTQVNVITAFNKYGKE